MNKQSTIVQSISSAKIRLVYILAASHSGSTLLAMLLNSHPDVCTVGELKATSFGDPDKYRCSCQRLIKECPFWNGIRQDMAKRSFDFDITNAGTDIRTGMSSYVHRLLKPLHRSPAIESVRDMALNLSPVWRKNLPKILARNLALIQCVASRTGKNVIVDSSKIGIRLKYLLRIPELEVRVIRAIRDGRGVALTYIDPARFADASDPKLRQGGMGGDRSRECLTMEQAAREWRRSNEEAEAVLQRLDKSQYTESRYESLCQNPDATLHRLFTFIGVDPKKHFTNFRNAEHHIVGNGMRLDSTSEIRLDERWQKELSQKDLDQFSSAAGDMMRKLGYS
ncbi:MAG: sulfotransferase [Chlorobium sp.]|nr:sulfotransferase [Chlorobium sp.]